MLPLLLILAHAADLPQTDRQVVLDLTVVPDTRRIEGTAEIRFTNRAQVALDAIPVHLYLNGYSGGASTWMSEDRGLRRAAFGEYAHLREGDDDWGWTRLASVRGAVADGQLVDLPWTFIAPDDGNPHDRSLAELQLAQPLEPGQTLTLKIAFASQLPEMSPRTGVSEDFVLAGHATPSIGLLEIPAPAPEGEPPAQPSWRAHQFHGQTEFFAAFADYRATIRAPEGWLVDGTGTLSPRQAPTDGVWQLEQRAVHDFSFVVVRGMQERWVEHPRPSGGAIRLHLLAPGDRTDTLDRVTAAVEHGLDVLDRNLGPYPYDDLLVVIPPESAQGSEAVEYAGMFLAVGASDALERWPMRSVLLPELVAAHELCHQYFQGLVATDEVEHAWLDEGFTDYWAQRIMIDRTGRAGSMGELFGGPLDITRLRGIGLRDRDDELFRDPLWSSPSYLYDRGRWGAQAYGRGTLVLQTLEGVFGQERTDRMMRDWFAHGRFRHPGPEDWLAVTAVRGGPEMAALARQAITRPELPDVRVDRADTWEREAPLGHIPQGDELVFVHDDTRDDFPADLALPFQPELIDGQLRVELTEGAVGRTPGGVRHVMLALEGEPADGPLHISRVRVEAPGWDALPIDVRLEFEDGVVLTETRTSGAVWWEYRVLHTAPLVRADVDPQRKIALDVWPENNGLTIEPQRDRARDWSAWFAASVGWIASTVGWWL